MTEVAAPTENGKPRPSDTAKPTGVKIEGGKTGRVQKGVEGFRGSATTIPARDRDSAWTQIPANIPETYDIDSSNYTFASFQTECKRTALLDLARADMDRVNLDREFMNKNALFDQSRSTHIMVHERWVKARVMLEATSNAANVYFVAEEEARQKHVVACRNRRVAEGGLDGAVKRSALAHAAVPKATKMFRTTNAQVNALQQNFNDKPDSGKRAVASATATPGNREIGRDGGGDTNNISCSNQECPARNRKRSHPESNDDMIDEVLTSSDNTVTTTNMRRSQDSAAGARDAGDRGNKDSGGKHREGCHAPKYRSTTGINALTREEERQSHARGLEAQHQIRARMVSQATSAVAAVSTTGTQTAAAAAAALEHRLKADKSELATANRSVKDAVASARCAAAEVNRAALELAEAVRAETQAAQAHWSAMDRAGPYVSWVNNEVTAQRNLRAWSDELMRTTSLAWEAREMARRELNEAGGRLSRAVRVLNSLSPGEKVDISRHTLFKAVVGDRRRQC